MHIGYKGSQKKGEEFSLIDHKIVDNRMAPSKRNCGKVGKNGGGHSETLDPKL